MRAPPTVHYFSIKDGPSKLTILAEVAQKHIFAKTPLLILCSDKTTLQFVSELLWKEPKEGFIVHTTAPSDLTLVKLTLPLPSYQDAESIFNLTSQPLVIPTPVKHIYEFEDLTHQSKREIFEKKFKYYQDAGYTLCSN